jgi:hypothetical protein
MAKSTTKGQTTAFVLVMLVLDILAVAGAMYFVQPVNAVISGSIAFALVSSLTYIAFINR